jgi:hypothetical protein
VISAATPRNHCLAVVKGLAGINDPDLNNEAPIRRLKESPISHFVNMRRKYSWFTNL